MKLGNSFFKYNKKHEKTNYSISFVLISYVVDIFHGSQLKTICFMDRTQSITNKVRHHIVPDS